MSKDTITKLVQDSLNTMALPVNVDKAMLKMLKPEEQKEEYKANGSENFLEPKQTGKGDKTIQALQALQILLGRDLSFPETLLSIKKLERGENLTVKDGIIVEA